MNFRSVYDLILSYYLQDICDITFSSFNRSDSYICERDRKVAEHVRWIPVTVAVARITDRKRRVIVIDLQDQSIQIIYKDEHIKDVLMCKDFLIIKRDPHPPKFFNLPMRHFFETHNRQLYPLLDQKGICHLLEEKETKQNGVKRQILCIDYVIYFDTLNSEKRSTHIQVVLDIRRDWFQPK